MGFKIPQGYMFVNKLDTRTYISWRESGKSDVELIDMGLLVPIVVFAPPPAAPTAPFTAIKTDENLLLEGFPAPGSPIPLGYEFRPENGETYQDYRNDGWSNKTMVDAGYLVKVEIPPAVPPLPPEYEWPKWAAAIIRFQASGNLCYIGVRDQIESINSLVPALAPAPANYMHPGSKFSIVKQRINSNLTTADVSKYKHTVAVHGKELVRTIAIHGDCAWVITEGDNYKIVNVEDLKPVDIEKVDKRKKEEIMVELSKAGLDPKSSLESIVSKLIELGRLK